MVLPERERGVCCPPTLKARPQKIEQTSEILKALADPTRLQMALSLRDAKEAICRRVGSDRKSTRLNSSHDQISYAVFCLKKKKNKSRITRASLFWRPMNRIQYLVMH